MTREELLNARRELSAQKLLIQAKIFEVDTKLQALCEHEWVLRPEIYGGRYCMYCGAENPDCDD